MPATLDWDDTEEIGIQLAEKFPDIDPLGVRFTDLQGFGDNTLEGVNTLHLNPKTYGNTGLGSTETYISPATIYGLDANDNKEPVTNNYSLSIAQQLPGNWILQASYVGNNSNSLMDIGTTQAVVLDNVNAIPVGTLFTSTAAAAQMPVSRVFATHQSSRMGVGRSSSSSR